MKTSEITNLILKRFYQRNYFPHLDIFKDEDEVDNPTIQINIDMDGKNSDSLAIFYSLETDKVLFVPIYEINESFTDEDLKKYNEKHKDNFGPFQTMMRPEGLDEIHLYGEIKAEDVNEEWIDKLIDFFENPNMLILELREMSSTEDVLSGNLPFVASTKLLMSVYGFERVRDIARLTEDECREIFNNKIDPESGMTGFDEIKEYFDRNKVKFNEETREEIY